VIKTKTVYIILHNINFRATTYFINRKSSYMSKHTWKLKDKDRPGENSCPGHFAERILKDRKIQNHP
jgi:hypothetical protein